MIEADPELVFWFFFLLLMMPFAAAAGWLLGGVRRRSRPKPPPPLWWLCDACRSVNAPDRERCYACRRPMPAAPVTLPTAPDFEMRQRFGPVRPIDEAGAHEDRRASPPTPAEDGPADVSD